MNDPATVVEQISADAATLDAFSKALAAATDALDAAEKEWETVLDAVTADLEEEFAEAGRKSVPEHTALSAARRAHRDLWVTYRSAKRRVERQNKQLSAKIAALNGRQSELKALTDEARTQGYAAQSSAVRDFNRGRAA